MPGWDPVPSLTTTTRSASPASAAAAISPPQPIDSSSG
jgi:hypothetical protein